MVNITVDKQFLVEIRRVPTLNKNTSESLNPFFHRLTSAFRNWNGSLVHIFQFRHTFRADAEIRRLSLLAKMRRAGSCNGQGIKRQKPGQVLSQEKLYPVGASFVGQNVPKHHFHCTSLHKYWQRKQNDGINTSSEQIRSKILIIGWSFHESSTPETFSLTHIHQWISTHSIQ